MSNVRILNFKTLNEAEEEVDESLLKDMSGEKCVAYVLNWQLAKKRAGTANTKLMSEISGTTRKPFKQKGTGRARQGTKRAPHMVGGRTCFGPLTRDFGYSIPKKIVKKALKFVLRTKIKEGRMVVLDGIKDLEISTNALNKGLESFGLIKGLVLYENEEENKNFLLSLRNIKHYKSVPSRAVNVYDMLNNDFLLIDRKSFENVKGVLQS